MSDLNDLPPLREVIRAHNLRAEKSLGQNFLLDLNLTNKIARCAGDLSKYIIFEVGPGPGGLTRGLLKAGAKTLIAVERDPRAVSALQDLVQAADGRLKVIEGDALKIDLMALANQKPIKIVANLPYNIATPLLIGWLRQIHEKPHLFGSMTLMFQKEVAERLASGPKTKTYGRLSVLAQWLCSVKKVMNLSPAAFTPPPKVTSTVVHFVPKGRADEQPSFEALEALTAAAFGQRRKMIRSSLKEYLPLMEEMGLDTTLRAEDLSVEDYISLARKL